MKYLFSAQGMKFLKKISRTQALFAFDYDGTLAPYIPDPIGGRISKDVVEDLAILRRTKKIAIISGRAVDDLRNLLGKVSPQYIVGNHGSEGVAIKGFSRSASKKACKAWHQRISKERIQGVVVEDKAFTLSLHYRNAKSSTKARSAFLKVIAELQPRPHVIFGKSVINLLPPKAPNKGTAVQAVLKKSGLKTALYFGDDKTDEDVFALKDRRIFGVRVGRSAASKADYFIKNQREIKKVFLKLICYSSYISVYIYWIIPTFFYPCIQSMTTMNLVQ
jgi:trehalose 6-phosphate phosphatase